MKNRTLRDLCIESDWFACGTNFQYEKLFEMNNNGSILFSNSSVFLDRIALIIWLCTDGWTVDQIKHQLLAGEAHENRVGA